jgi:signal transduction histidine kinase
MEHSPHKEIIISTKYNTNSKDLPIEIRVTDSACGIHRKDFDRIFEPFFTTKHKGTGLGLFISKALAGSIGGELEVENSWPYIGSIFLIKLPYIRPKE